MCICICICCMTYLLTNMSSALRLPITSGSILVALTTEETETRDWVCEILRDLIGVSIATTSTWAIITIMFRSAIFESKINLIVYILTLSKIWNGITQQWGSFNSKTKYLSIQEQTNFNKLFCIQFKILLVHRKCDFCRHVLIKYSDRGLVSGGQVSPLYGQLYLTVTLATSAFSYVVVEARHFRPYTEAQPALLKYWTFSLWTDI